MHKIDSKLLLNDPMLPPKLSRNCTGSISHQGQQQVQTNLFLKKVLIKHLWVPKPPRTVNNKFKQIHSWKRFWSNVSKYLWVPKLISDLGKRAQKVSFVQFDLDLETKMCFNCLNACLPLSLRVCKWRWRIIDWDGGGVGWYSEWLPYPNIWHMMPSAAYTSRTALLSKYNFKYRYSTNKTQIQFRTNTKI